MSTYKRLHEDIRTHRSHYIALVAIMAIALLMRVLGYEHITFGYDQARDAMESMRIFTHDPVRFIGPMTDIPGLFHGPLYWYVIAPFYYFGGGSPYVPKLALIVINIMSIPLIYLIAYRMWGDRRVGLLTALLYAVSLEAVQYARWMSNPSPAYLSTLVTWYALWLIYRRDWRGIVVYLLAWPFSVQFQFFFVYHLFIVVPLILWRLSIIKIVRARWRELGMALGGALFVLSPFVIGQIKFKFQSVIALFGFLHAKGGDSVYSRSLDGYVAMLRNNIMYNFGSLSEPLALVVLLLLLAGVLIVRPRWRVPYVFALGWFVSPVIIYAFGHHHSYFLTLGNIYALLMLVSVLAISLAQYGVIARYLVIALIIVSVSLSIVRLIEVKDAQEYLFSVQTDNDLASQRAAIEWVYETAGQRAFAINTLTNPLLRNTTWSYLYDQYGRKVYGVMPAWKGADQVGVFGEHIEYAQMPKQTGNLLYLMIEPEGGIPREYYTNFPKFEDRRSLLIQERTFGTYRVQQRVFTNEIGFDYNDLFTYVKDAPVEMSR